MNTERLTRLAALLRQPLPDKVTFNMDRWIEQNECGTACCAAGLAMRDPWFQAQGLEGYGGNHKFPRFADRANYGALAVFFDIPSDEAWCLFSPGYYTQDADGASTAEPEDVARKIDLLLATGALA